MAVLEARLAKLRAPRTDRRPAAAEAANLKAGLASMSRSVADIAPRNATVALAGAVDDLGQRLSAARDAGASESLLAPIEAMTRQVLDALRERDPRAAASALEREIRALGAKIDALAGASVDPGLLERIRRQSDEVRSLLASAAMHPVPVERLERQIGQLADRVEHIASSPTPRAEIVQILRLLSETHAQIEQSTPAAALDAIERHLEQLTARIDEALRRPAPAIDPRPIEDLARRVDGLRATFERRADDRPDLAPLEAALREINAKLDRAPEGAAESHALISTLQAMYERLEETLRQPRIANIDPKPIEELARRIDVVRATVERKSDFAPHAAKLEAALGDIKAKLDGGADSAAMASALQGLSARLDESLRQTRASSIDPKSIEDLARRIDGIRTGIERKADFAPHAARLEAALGDLGAKLQDSTDSKALATALQGMGARLEETLRQPRTASIDPKPIEDLARRIDGVRATVERKADFGPHAAKLEAALGDIKAKLDGGPDSNAMAAALQGMSTRLDESLRQPRVANIDPRPIEDLARRIDSVRATVERKSDFAPHAAKLDAALGDIRAKLEGGNDSKALATALQAMGARLDETLRLPRIANIDPKPIEDLARRIDSIKATIDRKSEFAPHAAKLHAALTDIRARLDGGADAKALATAVQGMGERLEEALRQPRIANIDPKPIEDLARRIDSVRTTVERKADFAPHAARLEAALDDIYAKLEAGGDSKAMAMALRDLSARFDETLSQPRIADIDPKPIEDLARRIENVRATVDRKGDFAPHAARIEAALDDLHAKLEAGGDSKAMAMALQDLSARLDESLRQPRIAEIDPKPIEDLARRIENVRTTVERKADFAPHAARIEAALGDLGAKWDGGADAKALASALQGISARLDESLRQPRIADIDPKPIADLARRIEDVRTTVERKSDFAPHAARLEAALDDIQAKLETGGDSKTIAIALQDLSARFDKSLRQPRIADIDPKPIEDLARRIDNVRTSVERKGDFAPHAARIEAALGDLGAKIDRTAASATEPSGLNRTLRDLTAKLEETFRRPQVASIDPRPLEDLGRRIDEMRATVEHEASRAPDAARLEAGLREIAAKLDQVATSPAPLDPRPLDDLARRIDQVRAALEQQADRGIDASALKAALGEIAGKLDRQAAATPQFDPGIFDEFTRRFDDVHAALADHAARGSETSTLEATLRDLAAKLERQATLPVTLDTQPLEDLSRQIEDVRATLEHQASRGADVADLKSALRGIDAKLERQAAAPVALDSRSLEELARRIEDVRATVERHADRGADVADLKSALREIDAKLDRQAASPVAIDARPLEELAQRIEEVRAALERQADPRLDGSELQAALREIGDKLDRQAESTHNVDPWAIDDIVRRIDDVRTTLEHRVDQHTGTSELARALRDISDKLDRQAASPIEFDPRPLEDLGTRIDHVRATLERQSEHQPDISRLDEALRDISAKLDRQAGAAEESRALLALTRELAERVETGATSGFDATAFERIARDLGERQVEVDTRQFEQLLHELGDRIAAIPSASIDIEPLERMLAQVDAKLDEMARSTADTGPLELAIHDLRDRLEQLPEPVLDASLVEHAADLLAKRLERRGGTVLDTEALVSQISEIHGRLDSFDMASSSNSALERAVTELIEELETTRQVLQSTSAQPSALAPLIGGISELRAEQAVSDRRMENRLSSVQGILEKLADRLSRVEDLADRDEAKAARPAPAADVSPLDEPLAARPAPSIAARNADLRDIPDRSPRDIQTPVVPPSVRPTPDSEILLEPGTGVPGRKAAINAHIAAARRAAQNAMAEQAEREQAPAGPSRGGKPPLQGIGSTMAQARGMFVKRRRPILLGATAAALTVAATVAVLELRGGHPKAIQKSELTEPTPEPSPVAEAASPAPTPAPAAKTPGAVDYRPTGAVDSASTKPSTATATPAKPAPDDMVSALPASLPAALHDAAAAGDAGAETELALRYLDGRTVARDPKLAARWLEIAANQGLPVAQYRFAALYEKGTGVARDLNLARKWYLEAANAGNARAMHNLAVLEAQDGGAGKPDYAEAATWFRRAAELGIRDSQFNLAVLSGRGLGIPQDLASSWMWFSLASRQGDSDAAKKRDEVAAKMDAAALAAAEKALAEFKVKTPDPKANETPTPAGGWDAKPQAARPAATGATKS